MVISHHARVRYCQRVLKIIDETEVKDYIRDHEREINNVLHDWLDDGLRFFKGDLLEYGVKEYVLSNYFVLVLNETGGELITLFPVQFGWSEKVTRATVDAMMLEIKEYEDKLATSIMDTAAKTEILRSKLEATDMEISAMELDLAQLKKRRGILAQALELEENEPRRWQSQIANVAASLVRSIDFRADILLLKQQMKHGGRR